MVIVAVAASGSTSVFVLQIRFFLALQITPVMGWVPLEHLLFEGPLVIPIVCFIYRLCKYKLMFMFCVPDGEINTGHNLHATSPRFLGGHRDEASPRKDQKPYYSTCFQVDRVLKIRRIAPKEVTYPWPNPIKKGPKSPFPRSMPFGGTIYPAGGVRYSVLQ